jgi:hypothetical protein
MTTSPDFTPVRFSTTTLPVRDRVPFWRDVVGREIVHVDIEPRSDAPLESKVSLRALPGLRSFECIASPAQVRRTQAFVADGDDSFALLVNVSGAMTFSQRGHEVSLDAGEAVLIMHAEPSIMNHMQIHMVGVAIPTGALAPLVPNFENVAMRPVPRGNDALRLLAGYLKLMHEDLPLGTPELCGRVSTHVHDLVAMAIGTTRDGAAIAAERGVRAARLVAIKADIAARLGIATSAWLRSRRASTSRRVMCKCCSRTKAPRSRSSSWSSVWPARINCSPAHAMPVGPSARSRWRPASAISRISTAAFAVIMVQRRRTRALRRSAKTARNGPRSAGSP